MISSSIQVVVQKSNEFFGCFETNSKQGQAGEDNRRQLRKEEAKKRRRKIRNVSWYSVRQMWTYFLLQHKAFR
jgi:hypothetical protein